jgi:MFS family permease
MHGFAYTFFYAAGFILLDSMTGKESRAGVHQLFTLAYGGVGGVSGSWLAGALLDACGRAEGKPVDFHRYWLMPLGLAVVVTLALLWRFRSVQAVPPPAAPSIAPPEDGEIGA